MRFTEFIRHVRPSYSPDWFHALTIQLLEEVVVTPGANLLISAPPGSGKTELIGILFATWLISEDLLTHIISLANSDGLSRIAAGNILRIIQSEQFQEICPITLDKATEQSFQVAGNDGRPTVHSAGIMGQLSGHRARWILYDDLTKNLSDAWSETVRERTWQNFNSCAETRLLPEGKIVGIQTRWTMDDTHGRLLRRALENPYARQFKYLNLAATNDGTQSFIQDTKTGSIEYLPAYKSLATIEHQPYSFSTEMYAGKQADLGPTLYSALYMGCPVASDNQMFPPDVWGCVEGVNTNDFGMIVTAWDTASRTKAKNDPSCNVVIGRHLSGDFVVLDYQEFKLTFDRLLPVVIERARALASQMMQVPVLVIEEADSGKQLLDVIRAQWPHLPAIGVHATRSKIIRAEAITPFTTSRLVKLLRADWNTSWIAKWANFPASDDDHVIDAGAMGLRVFTSTGADYNNPGVTYLPLRTEPEYEPENDPDWPQLM